MKKLSKTLLLWTLILFACSPVTITPETFPVSNPKVTVTVGTSNTGQSPDGNAQSQTEQCAFSWAQQPLDELTTVFEMSIKELNPDATARATAFGEDCNYSDGRTVFHAMETDFYIDLPVTDLASFETFGNWIAQTMSITASMPSDLIEGPHVGFVEYRFVANENESLVVRVPIQTYNDSAQGSSGEELFNLFYLDR